MIQKRSIFCLVSLSVVTLSSIYVINAVWNAKTVRITQRRFELGMETTDVERITGMNRHEGDDVNFLEYIVNKDFNSFARAIDMASKSWAKLASKRDRGLPNAVCFIYGVGLARLASHVLGSQVMVSNEHVPSHLPEEPQF
jgi:hypothetical protein